MKRLLTIFGFLLVMGGVATNAAAENDGVTELRLDVPAPDDVEGGVRAETRRMIGEKAIERIKNRLEAANVKFSHVVVEDDGIIVIEADPDHDAAALQGIVVPPGKFAVRTVRPIGSRWVELSGEMPEGVELRSGENPLDRDDTFVWSKSRQKLESFVSGVSIEDGDLGLYSTGDGWRTVTLGESLMSDEDVRSSRIRREPTGAPFVTLEVSPEARSAFDALTEPERMRFAAVLDGEIVSLMKSTALSEHQLNIAAPDHLSGWDALIGWAQQVAGRLAAPIPVRLMPLQEET